MRILVGIGELVAVIGALGAIARLGLWGVQWGRKRARRNDERSGEGPKRLSR
jgi:hypothetical protein